MKIASGNLWIPEDLAMQNDSTHIEISWTNSLEGNSLREDQLLLVLCDETTQTMQCSLQAYRSAGHFIWEPGFGFPVGHAWAAFIRQDRSIQSEPRQQPGTFSPKKPGIGNPE